MDNFKETLEGEYIVRTYENGTIIKSLISHETKNEVVTLPENPILKLEKENKELAGTVAKLSVENKKKDAMADTMAQTIAKLNLRISKLEKEGR